MDTKDSTISKESTNTLTESNLTPIDIEFYRELILENEES